MPKQLKEVAFRTDPFYEPFYCSMPMLLSLFVVN
ncbi:hypothetical protein SCARR_02055 [Pontiella sulfatireligans]|uniref:Uncharacterized protein n=1 Tax=Pontiella sulfatireligans TaxID=2750658 RepID=A0A6C2UIG2_9BACT|nr:hypothetical protein SCARR_02055 [Pontiella sulfatireligans]